MCSVEYCTLMAEYETDDECGLCQSSGMVLFTEIMPKPSNLLCLNMPGLLQHLV